MSAYELWSKGLAEEISREVHARRGPLTMALRHLTDRFGYLGPSAVEITADIFNLSKAEVAGVISFYDDFKEDPPAQTTIRICQAEACQAVGARELTKHAQDILNTKLDTAREDRSIALEPVACLGLCACGPAVMVNGKLFGRVTTDKLDELQNISIGEEQDV